MANSPSGESLVQRLTRILQSFDRAHPVLTAAQIASRAGLATSTAHRIVQDMVAEGLLVRTADDRYRIGLVLWELTHRSSFYQEFGDVARPFLEGMHHALQQTVSLAILHPQDTSIIYLDRIARRPDPTDLSRIAGRLPVLSTAPGLAMLAFSTERIQQRYLARAHEDPHIIKQGLTQSDLEDQLRQVRATGWAHSAEVVSAGSSGTAAPVFGRQNQVMGALSVVVPVEELELTVQVPVLLAAARSLSQWLSRKRRR